MLQPHAKTQQKILDHINKLPDDANITVPMFYHLITARKCVINRALRKLCLKGVIEFSHSEPTNRGGQEVNIYKKVQAPKNDTFEFGLIKKGVFADLFAKPEPVSPLCKVTEVRMLSNSDEDSEAALTHNA